MNKKGKGEKRYARLKCGAPATSHHVEFTGSHGHLNKTSSSYTMRQR